MVSVCDPVGAHVSMTKKKYGEVSLEIIKLLPESEAQEVMEHNRVASAEKWVGSLIAKTREPAGNEVRSVHIWTSAFHIISFFG